MHIDRAPHLSTRITLPPPQGEAKARADRARGGQRSAKAQQRDSFGQFAGGPRQSHSSAGAGAQDLSTARCTDATSAQR